jgi:hypothetical protein
MATAKKTKRRRIDTLIDAHVWLRKMANKKVTPHDEAVPLLSLNRHRN